MRLLLLLLIAVSPFALAHNDDDRLWYGECQVRVQFHGHKKWFSWENVEYCKPGLKSDQLRIKFVGGDEVVQWMGGRIISVLFEPLSPVCEGVD